MFCLCSVSCPPSLENVVANLLQYFLWVCALNRAVMNARQLTVLCSNKCELGYLGFSIVGTLRSFKISCFLDYKHSSVITLVHKDKGFGKLWCSFIIVHSMASTKLEVVYYLSSHIHSPFHLDLVFHNQFFLTNY